MNIKFNDFMFILLVSKLVWWLCKISKWCKNGKSPHFRWYLKHQKFSNEKRCKRCKYTLGFYSKSKQRKT